MAGFKQTSFTTVPGPETTPELVHSLLEKHSAWDKSFYEFQTLISESVEGSHTIHTSWDNGKLKDAWETVQYVRRYFVSKSSAKDNV